MHLVAVVVGAAKCNELLSLRVAPQGQPGFPQPSFALFSLSLLEVQKKKNNKNREIRRGENVGFDLQTFILICVEN